MSKPPLEQLRCEWTRGQKWRCRQLKFNDSPYCENHAVLAQHKSSEKGIEDTETKSLISIKKKCTAKRGKHSRHIPFDVISDYILPRLPVKSLIRFTPVSKRWESFIKSPEFIVTHRDHNLLETKGQYSMILKDESSYVVQNQKPVYFENLTSISEYSIVFHEHPAESCNGLILFHVDNIMDVRIEFLLWNPSIRKCKSIQSSDYRKWNFELVLGDWDFYNVLGLGFLESSNDYRVVRIHYLHVNREVITHAELYSLRTDSWDKVLEPKMPTGLVALSGGVFLNGNVHWLATRDVKFSSYSEHIWPKRGYLSIESILFFDFEKQCFGEMVLPESFDYDQESASLVVFKEFEGSLAAVLFDYNDNMCSVWVMSEYGDTSSWYKKLSISLPKKYGNPVGFTKNGMLVCREYEQEDRLPKSKKAKKSNKKVPGFIFLDSSFEDEAVIVIDYKESLALLA